MSDFKERSRQELSDRWAIPRSWIWTSMGEICEVVGGGTPSTDDPTNFVGGDIPWITPADLTGYRSRTIANGSRYITSKGLSGSGARILPAGTILFSSRAPIGYVAVAANAVSTSQGFKSFIPPQGVSSEYLHYYLQFAKPLAVELASGTTFPEISGKRAAEIPLALAPESKQAQITDKLDELFSDLDAGVASLQRARANLKRYRAAVLKSAVEGRLTADWRAQHPPSETGPELLARLLRERRLRWEEAQLTKFEASSKAPPNGWRDKYTEPVRSDASPPCALPLGWHWASLDVVLASGLSNGRSVPTAEVGFPVLRLTAIRGGWIDLTASKIGDWVREDAAPYLVREGDFLISRGNGSLRLVGRGALVRDAFDEVAFPDTMIRARFGPGLLPRFARHLWEASVVRKQVEKLAKTSAGIYKVAQTDLEQIAIPVPPVSEQVRIVELLDQMLVSAERSEIEIERSMLRSTSLRQSILKRAFSGQLVPQDPANEPASVLLERIRAARASAPATHHRPAKCPTPPPPSSGTVKLKKPRGRPRRGPA